MPMTSENWLVIYWFKYFFTGHETVCAVFQKKKKKKKAIIIVIIIIRLR